MNTDIRIVQVLMGKIPLVWETIKFAVTKVDEINGSHTQSYLTNLLHELMSNNAQCFLVMDNQERIKIVAITKIKYDKIFDEKNLILQTFYAFESSDQVQWEKIGTFFKEFGKKEGCKNAIFVTKNPKLFKIGEENGCKELYRKYSFEIGE